MTVPLNRASLAWRHHRHALDPAALAETATEVRQRVLAIRGWPFAAADLAVCVRQATPLPGSLERALDAGEMVRSYAFRGGSYAFTPDTAALVLSVRTATRIWETRRWQLSTRLAETPLAHLAPTGAGADSLYKPLHWWGDICFGPQRDGKATFRLLRGDPRWPGSPPVDDAGRELIIRYLNAYGPATAQNLHYWFTEGLGVPRRRLQAWLADLPDQVALVECDEEEGYALNADLEALRAAEPTRIVRLLPAFDPWILGPGMADARLISPSRRDLFSRGANPVVAEGVVAGTWRLRESTVDVTWFREAGDTPREALEADVERLSRIYARDLSITSAAS